MAIVHLDSGSLGQRDSASDAEFVEGLRRRSADGLERAYAFLCSQQDRRAILRAEVLCEGRPASDLSDALTASQAVDGSLPVGSFVSGGALGFPPIDLASLSPKQQKIVGTLEGLLQAGDARLLHAKWVEAAARFFDDCQDEDGAFRVATIGDEPAPQEAEIFFTGMIAGILGRTPVSRPSLLESAGAFLGKRFDPNRVEHEGYAALLAYSHFFTNVAHDLSDEALQWCGRALEKGFRSRQLDAVSTLRVLLTCEVQAMPGASFDTAELLQSLLEEQAGDGGFAELSLGGPEARTTQTLDAMLAMVRLCAVLGE